MIPFPIWREAFINDADMEVAKWTHSQLSPEPYQPLKDKLDLKKFYSLATPKSYINCTEDTALPQGEWGWHPRMSNRLGLYRLVQMPGSHEVIYTNPKGLGRKNHRSRTRLENETEKLIGRLRAGNDPDLNVEKQQSRNSVTPVHPERRGACPEPRMASRRLF